MAEYRDVPLARYLFVRGERSSQSWLHSNHAEVIHRHVSTAQLFGFPITGEGKRIAPRARQSGKGPRIRFEAIEQAFAERELAPNTD